MVQEVASCQKVAVGKVITASLAQDFRLLPTISVILHPALGLNVHRITNYFRILNALSIDVAVGAMCCALFFARVLHVQLLAYGIAALGLSVWIIYTTDHLLDARKISDAASTFRHRFHQRNFRKIMRALSGAMIANVVLLFFIREQVLAGGIFLSTGVCVYLIVQRFSRMFKELLISILYTCGVILPAFMVTTLSLQQLPWLLILQFAFTAFINLLVFSWFDAANDTADGATSFATVAGKKTTLWFVWLLFGSVCLITLFTQQRESILLNIVAAIQILLPVFRNYVEANDRYRIIGDAAFTLPVLLFLS